MFGLFNGRESALFEELLSWQSVWIFHRFRGRFVSLWGDGGHGPCLGAPTCPLARLKRFRSREHYLAATAPNHSRLALISFYNRGHDSPFLHIRFKQIFSFFFILFCLQCVIFFVASQMLARSLNHNEFGSYQTDEVLI